MLVAAGAACAAAVDRWGSDGTTAGGRCGITGVCGTAAGADDCSAEVAGRWDDDCRRLRRHTEAQLSRRSWRWQGRMALAGPHAMSLEGRRSRLRRRSGSGARDAGAGRRRSGVRRCRR